MQPKATTCIAQSCSPGGLPHFWDAAAGGSGGVCGLCGKRARDGVRAHRQHPAAGVHPRPQVKIAICAGRQACCARRCCVLEFMFLSKRGAWPRDKRKASAV